MQDISGKCTKEIVNPAHIWNVYIFSLQPIQFNPRYCPLLAMDNIAYGCQQLVSAAPGAGLQGVEEQRQGLQLQLLSLTLILHDIVLPTVWKELPNLRGEKSGLLILTYFIIHFLNVLSVFETEKKNPKNVILLCRLNERAFTSASCASCSYDGHEWLWGKSLVLLSLPHWTHPAPADSVCPKARDKCELICILFKMH